MLNISQNFRLQYFHLKTYNVPNTSNKLWHFHLRNNPSVQAQTRLQRGQISDQILISEKSKVLPKRHGRMGGADLRFL